MILKFEKIANIGNFEDFKASGDVTLKRANFIYAENGSGKTTLSRILHSLSSNDPDIIEKHKRIGSVDDCLVSIKIDDSQRIFKDKKWNQSMPEITVFDTHFVTNNIYSGFIINGEHKKNLYKFVLGNAGVEIAKKIERVKRMIDGLNRQINVLEENIDKICRPVTVNDFINFKEVPNIDELLKEKDKEFQLAINNEVIKQHAELCLLPLPYQITREEIEYIRDILETSIENIGQHYIDQVKNQLLKIESKGLDKTTEWIFKGFQYIKRNEGEPCPLCGQALDGLELIKGYNQYFNKSYTDIQKSIENILMKIENINIKNYLSLLDLKKKTAQENYKFWKNYVSGQEKMPELDIDVNGFIEASEKIITLLRKKKKETLAAIHTEGFLENFWSLYSTMANSVNQLNEYIEKYNQSVTELKSKIRNKEEVEKELREISIKKNRFEAKGILLCKNYEILHKQLKRLNKINKKLQQEQKEASTEIVNKYGTQINEFLTNVFHTPFKIKDIKDGGIKGRSKEANLSYCLTFNDVPLELESDSNISFKNVLSEGDKSTIAFSFYLAKLNADPDLANKIIVFDDPLSSLDLNRRNSTINQLVLKYASCHQIIILSHNLHFLVDLQARKEFNHRDKKVLQIYKAHEKSIIREYEIKKEWVGKYKKSMISMISFQENPASVDQNEAVASIRVALETFLKLKYCLYIPDENQPFGKIVSDLEKDDNCKFLNVDKQAVINNLKYLVNSTWQPHHAAVEDWEEGTEESLTTAEAHQLVELALNLLNEDL